MIRSQVLHAFFLFYCLAFAPSTLADNWPRFRGPGGTGISDQTGLPVKWSADDYAWKTKLPGLGHSSPCVWEDQLFLTTAEGEGSKRSLLAFDTKTGDLRWSRSIVSKTHAKHNLNSYASATPTANGKHVFVLFASDEQMLVVAYDFGGNEAWKRDLGPFVQKQGQVHGCGTSPIVFEDLVIIANQQDGPASIIALEAATGETKWKSDRKLRLTAHSTPFVLQRQDSPPRLFSTNTGDGFLALDPRTGEELYRADVLGARCVGSAVVAADFILATSGTGGRGHELIALPVDGKGTLDKSNAGWTRKRNLPYVPTPISFGDHLFLWSDIGVVTCLQSKTGEEVWTERVGGNYSGSPVCIDGKLYCIASDGTVVVIAASPEYKLLGKTELGEGCHSTPAVAGGKMFIRGFETLFCLPVKR